MKPGDLIYIVGSHRRIMGTIISPWKTNGWWNVLTIRGDMIHWPEFQLELISEGR